MPVATMLVSCVEPLKISPERILEEPRLAGNRQLVLGGALGGSPFDALGVFLQIGAWRGGGNSVPVTTR